MLGGRGQPHAVHDRGIQPGEQGRAFVGVNRVAVAGDRRERAHVHRRGDGDVAPAPPRGVGGVARHRSPGPNRVGEFSWAGPAADGEPLLQNRQHRTAGVVDVHGDRNHPAEFGVVGRRRGGGDGQFGLLPRQRFEQACGVVEVHQAEQTLHHRKISISGGAADCGEDRRPAAADQRIGHRGQGGRQRCPERRGDTGVIGDPVGIPLDPHGARAADERGQRLRPVHPGGDGQHRPHGGGGVGGDDHRGTSVDDGRREGEGDVDPGAGQRHAQHHPIGTDDLQPRAGGRVCRRGGIVHLPLRRRGQPVHQVGGGAARPQHIRGVQHDGQRAGDVRAGLQPGRHRLGLTSGGQYLGHGSTFETIQQFPDRLVESGDSRDGGGARDYAHLIGVVAGVVGLPQRITAPPAADVLVDHRHEVHRLARNFAHFDEVRCVGGMQQHRGGVRITLQQRLDGPIRVLQHCGVTEDRLD